MKPKCKQNAARNRRATTSEISQPSCEKDFCCRDPENMLPKEVATFEFKITKENKIICTQISIWKVLGHL